MKATIGSHLILHNAPLHVAAHFKALSTLENPLWHKLMRMGKTRAVYGCPKEFRYWAESKDRTKLALGRGMLEEFCLYMKRDYEIVDETAFPKLKTPLTSSIVLRPYQEGIPEQALARSNGIIRLGTGFGKTIIGLKIAELLQARTLIIVPRLKIQEQFCEDIKKYFGCTAAAGGEEILDESRGLVVITLQLLSRIVARTPRDELKTAFGLVLVDECHTTVPEKSRKVIQSFAPHYLYGLTATPRRTDGQGKALEFIYGPVRCSADLPRDKPSVEICHITEKIRMGEYAEIIKAQTESVERNRIIAERILADAHEQRTVVVFTKRVEHGRLLYAELERRQGEQFREDCLLFADAHSFVRDLSDYRARTSRDCPRVLIGTFSLLSTGIDLPSLDTMVIAGDLKSDVLQEQSVGRILRLFEGKQSPKIIDFVDLGNPILKAQGRTRLKFYAAQEWDVTIP